MFKFVSRFKDHLLHTANFLFCFPVKHKRSLQYQNWCPSVHKYMAITDSWVHFCLVYLNTFVLSCETFTSRLEHRSRINY